MEARQLEQEMICIVMHDYYMIVDISRNTEW